MYIKQSINYGAVAQLARAIRSHRIGRGFDSHLLHHVNHTLSTSYVDSVFLPPRGFVTETHIDFSLEISGS